MGARLPILFCVAAALVRPVAVLHAQTTLGDALNATDLVWTTGGTGGVGWMYVAENGGENTFDGIASAVNGHIGGIGESWVQTTVVGPGTVSFWWKAFSNPNTDWLQFYVGSDLQAQISGLSQYGVSVPTDWEYCSFAVPAGTNTLKWRYVKNGTLTGGTLDCGWVDKVSYITAPPPPLSLALNTCGAVWSTAGSAYTNGWFAQTNVTHDGQWAAQSGAIWDNQTNWLQTTVSGVTNVSFWWKVSSQTNTPKQANGDYLAFYTNGVLAKQICGEVDWQSNYFKLPSKTNTLTWLYRKDPMTTMGSDCGWVDQVTFSATFKAAPYTLQAPARLPDGRIQLVVSGEAGCPCQLQFTTNAFSGTNWSAFTNFTTTDLTTAIIDPASTNSPMRYYRAVSP